MNDYASFIAAKLQFVPPVGISAPVALSARMFPFQARCVEWALARGRAALFEDCGLGKTIQALEWARQVAEYSKGRVLILAPLAVSQQTVREGAKFGIPVAYAREPAEMREAITITNYERLDRFDPAAFAGVVLDECFAPDTRVDVVRGWDELRVPICEVRGRRSHPQCLWRRRGFRCPSTNCALRRAPHLLR